MSETDTKPVTEVAAGAAPVIKPTLHHYGVLTKDIDVMVDWYAKVVGFEVTSRGVSPIDSAYVSNDRAHHRSGFFTVPGINDEGPRPHVGVQHVAFEYETVDDLLSSWQRLRDIGIEPVVMTCHHTHWAFYYQDPENTWVELLADTFGDWDASMEKIRTSEYAEDPMGKRVDPELMIEARKQGATLDELRVRTMAGEFEPESYAPPTVML